MSPRLSRQRNLVGRRYVLPLAQPATWQTRREVDAVRVNGLRDRLLARLQASVQLTVNGRLDRRLPNNLNLSFSGVDGEALVMHVRDRLTVATGSACTSRSLDPLHVLLAMGLTKADAE